MSNMVLRDASASKNWGSAPGKVEWEENNIMIGKQVIGEV